VIDIRQAFCHSAIALTTALLISSSLFANPLATPPEVAASAAGDQESHTPTRQHYLSQIDQQLKDLESRIGALRIRKRSLQGPERERLSANIRMLKGKIREARRLRKQMGHFGIEWLTHKKELDAKVIRLRKSLTYIMNTIS